MKKAVIVGVNINNDEFFEESLKELKGLAKACDIKVVGTLTQNLKTPNKKSFIGPGKIETLSALAESYEADVIIFDNELSPLQYKTLESILNALAEAIRVKKETNEIVYGNKMPGKILTIKNKIDGYEIYDGTIEVK
jgi:hypothetical protein